MVTVGATFGLSWQHPIQSHRTSARMADFPPAVRNIILSMDGPSVRP